MTSLDFSELLSKQLLVSNSCLYSKTPTPSLFRCTSLFGITSFFPEPPFFSETENETQETDLNSSGCSFRQSIRLPFEEDDPQFVQLYKKWNDRIRNQRFYVRDLTSFIQSSSRRQSNDERRGSDLSEVDQVNNNYHSSEDEEHEDTSLLRVDEDFTFRIIVLQVIGVAKEYRDLFCQFNFLHLPQETFSTEPIKNTGSGPPPGFFRIQNVTVKVTKAFKKYLKTQPLLFEVFGHYQQHPLDKESKDTSSSNVNHTTRQVPRRLIPKQLPISTPVKSQRYHCPTVTSNAAQVHGKYDIMVWLEICELAPTGEYIPVSVEVDEESACPGTFCLQQGIQRRIRMTLIHEYDVDVQWREIRELVVGRVRSEAEVDFEDDEDDSILSLSLFPGEFLQPLDNRVVFQVEAAWDTSLHNNVLLNRVTPSGERVYLTLSAYIDLEKCTQPVVVTKDICLIVFGRDSRMFTRSNARTLKQLFNFKQEQIMNRASSVYELILRRVIDTASPGVQRRERKVLDTSSTYVRGEENLIGWQPRGDSLIFEHQWELEKITRIELVERMRHILAVRETLKHQDSQVTKLNMSSSRMNLAALTSPPSPVSTQTMDEAFVALDEREKEICHRVLLFLQNQVPSKSFGQQQVNVENSNSNNTHATSNHSSPEETSPDKMIPFPAARPRTGILSDVSKKVSFTPEMEEVRLNPTTSRKGELAIMDERTNKWTKHWLVVRRPYLFMFKDEKDLIERAVINLTDAQVDFCVHDDPKEESLVFSVTTRSREYWFRASSGKEVHDWLYAINPLLAGEILSKLSRSKRDSI